MSLKLTEEDEIQLENDLELFADIICDDSYHYAMILKSYHDKSKSNNLI